MKKVILAAAIAVMSMAAPVAAQQNNPRPVNNETGYNDNNDGVSPWWGLLGLIGLFGLMRRNDRVDVDTHRPVTR